MATAGNEREVPENLSKLAHPESEAAEATKAQHPSAKRYAVDYSRFANIGKEEAEKDAEEEGGVREMREMATLERALAGDREAAALITKEHGKQEKTP